MERTLASEHSAGMSCFCHKLFGRQYSQVSETEAQVLTQTWKEAPQLFQTTPPLEVEPALPTSATPSRARKRPRICGSVSSVSNDLIPHQSQRRPPEAVLDSTQTFATATASNLETTYSPQNAVIVLKGNPLEIQPERSIFVGIYLAIERCDQFQRLCYYAFAKLHKKGTTVDPIVKEIDDVLRRLCQPSSDTRNKVYHFLHIGNKWVEIIEQFASIVQGVPQQLTGLLCLLGSASTWERAPAGDRELALSNLHKTTDIHQTTLEITPFVNKTLSQISLPNPFIDETPKFISQSNLLLGSRTMATAKSSRNRLTPGANIGRAVHTASAAEPTWKAPSLAAVCEAVPEPSNIRSEDASILLVLLSFLATSEEVPLDLLLRGATPRRRWNARGEVEEVDAVHAGLAPELGSFLSDPSRLRDAFHELDLSSAVSKKSDDSYTLNEAVASRVRERLRPEHLSFWKCHALLVAYRAIPWKYTEPTVPNSKLFLQCLKHALQPFQGGFEHLPTSTRADLILTLLEASRFPKMEWKRFAVSQAGLVMLGLEDRYLRARVAQAESLLWRLTGDMDRSAGALASLNQDGLSDSTDRRMHSAIGLTAVQRALNGIQVEDLSMAEKSLVDWTPLGEKASPMEEAVLFCKHMIFGRILRFGGRFEESRAQLERSLDLSRQLDSLNFDEDLRDLICDLADTLRELGDPVSAERHLRTEIGYRGAKTPLELSLAEALFAQGRSDEAEELCLDIQSRPRLLKLEKLRLCITQAKLRHIASDYDGAFPHWANAMVAISKFQIETGGTTRAIVASICDILNQQGRKQLLDQSRKQMDTLDKLARPGIVWFWIAGLRHWQEYLQAQDNFLRGHL